MVRIPRQFQRETQYDLTRQEAWRIVEMIDPFHSDCLSLGSLEDFPASYLDSYLRALAAVDLHPTKIVEISLSEALLPVDSLPGSEKLRQSVRRGIASGIGLGMQQHFSDYLQERYVVMLAENPRFDLERSGLLDADLYQTVVNRQMLRLNGRYHQLFRPKLIGSDRLPFSFPAVLYYQIALVIARLNEEAARVEAFNRFIFDGLPPAGMLDDDTFAILGR